MATFTSFYNLRKPAGSDLVNEATDLNANWDIVDAELGLKFGVRQIVTFTASGSFVKGDYPWLRAVRVTCVGGGGAGGGSNDTPASESSAGIGGGSGGYSVSIVPVASLASSETVTIGAGGTGVSDGTGNTGGNTSFGVHCIANGGPGGAVLASSGTADVTGYSTNAAAGTGNIVALEGSSGGNVIRVSTVQIVPGYGAPSLLSPITRPPVDVNDQDGNAGKSYGGGGSGSISRDTTGTANVGGAGAAGIIIVELLG